MTSLTSQDGKLVVRDGKLGTEKACCCGDGPGVCCECEGVGTIASSGQAPSSDPSGMQESVDSMNAGADELAAQLLANGYECIEIIYGEFRSDGPEGAEYSETPTFISARCCGTRDTEQEELVGNWFGQPYIFLQPPAYPCVQDETTRTCVPGLTEQECNERCGDFHPNQTCGVGGIDCSNPLP